MSVWKVGVEQEITIVTVTPNVNFKAYYASTNQSAYAEIPGTFTKNESRYYLPFTFDLVGHYIIRIVENNGNLIDHFATIQVIDPALDLEENLDAYPNKDEFKATDEIAALSTQLNTKLDNNNTVVQFKIDDIKNTLISETDGLVKIINDIANLPDGTKLDTLLTKIDLIQTKISGLKKKTVAFINKA